MATKTKKEYILNIPFIHGRYLEVKGNPKTHIRVELGLSLMGQKVFLDLGYDKVKEEHKFKVNITGDIANYKISVGAFGKIIAMVE